MNSQILQHVVLPGEQELEDNWELYYKGNRGIVADNKLYIPQYGSAEFYTYLNSFSNRKWKKYTSINKVKLVLSITGECEVVYAGYSLPMYNPEKKIFDKVKGNYSEDDRVEFVFPDNDEQILGFEIRCLSNCILNRAWYETEVNEDKINAVELAIATTTCKKERFIKKNIKTLYEELFLQETTVGKHLNVHIIDNGRTLKRDDFPEHERIQLHSNKNVGGSGGFARGMIESINQKPEATNVLLMDDDVLILPESIYRTYMLLRLQKKEYKNAFINGAMLYYEDKNCQHEDIGTISNIGRFSPRKPRYCMTILRDVLDNERWFPKVDNQYGAWWYCCIPVDMIKKNGLPLPLFIRGDDAEYGLRCKPKFITMNGICIWHMGFTAKYNASFDLYQTVRNLLIAKSTTEVLKNVDLIWDYSHKFRTELMRFNYDAAELLVRAMKDYLKGPDFISVDSGEKIMKENAKKNEQLQPLKTFKSDNLDLGLVFVDVPRGKFKRILYGITYNGQRFVPNFLLKKDFATIPFNHVYTPSKAFWRKQLLAVNPDNRTAIMRNMDKKRFKAILNENRKVMRYYKIHKDEIEKEYRNNKNKLTSLEFWKNYLEINNK